MQLNSVYVHDAVSAGSRVITGGEDLGGMQASEVLPFARRVLRDADPNAGLFISADRSWARTTSVRVSRAIENHSPLALPLGPTDVTSFAGRAVALITNQGESMSVLTGWPGIRDALNGASDATRSTR